MLRDRAATKSRPRVAPGNEMVTFETEHAQMGLTICYDIRFPELYRALTLAGAKVIFQPAAFTLYTGKDHWETLIRARAIENQVYMVSPAQIGTHGNGNKPSAEGALVYLNGGEDLAVPLSRVEQAGGKVLMPKTSIGENGFMAIFTDTEGNRVAFHSMN